jgi:hypothetical protein
MRNRQKMNWTAVINKLAGISTQLKEARTFYFWSRIYYMSNIQVALVNSGQVLMYIHIDTYENNYYVISQLNDAELNSQLMELSL